MLHYLLRDVSISPKVSRPILPNGSEINNIQFVDDVTILFQLDEDNMMHLMAKLDLFCSTSGSKISVAKSIILGWDPIPSNRCIKYGLSWGGLN